LHPDPDLSVGGCRSGRFFSLLWLDAFTTGIF
jgi:hypothetical protein